MALKILHYTLIFWSSVLIFEATNAAHMINEKLLNEGDNSSALQSGEEETDCQVHKFHITDNWPEKALIFLAFMEYGEVLSCKIEFKNHNEDLVYDQLFVSYEGIKIYKVRNGIVNETTLNKVIDTAGWTLVEVSMTKQFILKFWNITALTYTLDQPANKLLVYGSNITVCKEKSPTWIIEKGITNKIPLESSRQVVNPLIKRTHVLTLQSDDDFVPCIIVDGNTTCLELKTSKPSLRGTIFDVYLVLVNGFINIYQEIEGKREDITSISRKGITFIEFTSGNSTFSVSLNVFGLPKSSAPPIVTDNVTKDYDLVTIEALDDKSFNFGNIVYLFIGIAIGISLCGTIVILYVLIRLRKKLTSNLKSSMKGNNESTNLRLQQMFISNSKNSVKDDANNESTNQKLLTI